MTSASSGGVGGTLRRLAPWLLLLALSLGLHLWDLGERSYHHDEAIHAHSAYNLANNGVYRYDPTYHGPLLYYLVAGTFLSPLGDSDFTARLPVALAGVLLVVVAYCLRRPLGGRAAWWTGLLATVSPITLYYGRFLRMDVLELLVASAAGVAVWRAAKGSSAAWAWFGVYVGLAFATKENAYVTGVLVVWVWGLMSVVTGLKHSLPATFGWLKEHRWGILMSVAMSVLVVVPLFTIGFRYPEDWFFPGKAISYWWGQHNMQRVAGPPWFHLPRLAAYEFLPIIAATAWVVRRRGRLRLLEGSLYLFAVSSVCMYAYLGEKVPWLGVHQVWAFLPLAGLQLARTFGPRGRWWSRGLAGLGLAATAVVSFSANFVNDEISPNLKRTEMILYVQTSPEVVELAREGEALAAEGHDTVAAVAGTGGWPMTWYWRETPTRWSEPTAGLRPPLVISDAEDEQRFRRMLGPGYRGERIPLRSWWVLDPARTTLGGVVRWLFTREPFSPVGSTDIMVFRQGGETDMELQEVGLPTTLAEELGASSAEWVGEGWLSDPRGLAVAVDGRIAVADPALDRVHLFSPDGQMLELGIAENLDRPDGVAWAPGGILVVADTWSHRVLLHRPGDVEAVVMPEPGGGWFGPRSAAVAGDGTIAVADTGNKRVVLYEPGAGSDFAVRTIGSAGAGPGELSEPVGLAWIDDERLVVCDTGNHRLQILHRSGHPEAVIELGGIWTDFYARPQVAVMPDGRFLVSDTPDDSLWLVDTEQAHRIELGGEGITPTGLAVAHGALYLGDSAGRIWVLELS